VKRVLSVVAKCLVSALLLLLVFRMTPFAQVRAALREASLPLFAAGFLVGLLSLWASAVRLKCLTELQGMSISVRGHVLIHLYAAFYGLFLPGVLAGSVLRWNKMRLPDRNAAGALVVVLLNRLIGTTVTAGAGVLLWLVAGRRENHPTACLALLVVFLGLLALQVGLLHEGVAGAIFRFLDAGGRFSAPLRRTLRKVAEAIGHLHGMPRETAVRIVGLALAEEVLGIVTFVLFARAVRIDLSLPDLGWIRAFVAVAVTMPVSIAGLGIREGSLVVLLAPYSVPGGSAVALSALLLARSVILGLAGGLAEAKNLFQERKASPPHGGR
jgi:glycosyltransferase 2 family protein